MSIKKITGNLTLLVSVLLIFGCGQDLPFDYKFVSANTVQINYMDKVYELDRYGPKLNTPFEYQFESDGDLDIMIAGESYDIDSPYDIDKPKKKKTKKKRSTSKRSSSKRTTKKKK